MRRVDYQKTLYPLQDRVLALINSLQLPFYLTGGTALSRHYLHHRYSDDLDLFVNNEADFRDLVDCIEAHLVKNTLSFTALTRSADFVRLLIIAEDNTHLKLDLVNDLVCHFGDFEQSQILGRVDNIMNILSNKISAIPRLEIKDFVDIICIAHKYHFSWSKIILEATQKDGWVNPLDVAKYFSTLDPDRFDTISWMTRVDFADLNRSCQIIADEIVKGSENSLVK